MKKFLIFALIALFFTACNDDSSSSSDTTFRIQPDDLTAFTSPSNTGTVNGNSYNYGIIYNGKIDGINYIGIACSDNTKYPEAPTEVHNFKLYYQSNSISDITLNGGSSAGFKVFQDGTEITGTGTYNLHFESASSGSYTRYTITITGALSETIYATYVGPN